MKQDRTYQVIKAATKILIPSGRELMRCKEALRLEYGLKVPNFPDRVLSIKQGNVTFLKVKGKDIPRYIAAGYGDIGVTGSDICEGGPGTDGGMTISQVQIGAPICTFELLVPMRKFEKIKERLMNFSLPPVQVATHYPNVLQKYTDNRLNLVIAPIKPSGCVEIAPVLGIAEAAADTVASGETAKQNNLARIPLEDVYPTVVYKDMQVHH